MKHKVINSQSSSLLNYFTIIYANVIYMYYNVEIFNNVVLLYISPQLCVR